MHIPVSVVTYVAKVYQPLFKVIINWFWFSIHSILSTAVNQGVIRRLYRRGEIPIQTIPSPLLPCPGLVKCVKMRLQIKKLNKSLLGVPYWLRNMFLHVNPWNSIWVIPAGGSNVAVYTVRCASSTVFYCANPACPFGRHFLVISQSIWRYFEWKKKRSISEKWY